LSVRYRKAILELGRSARSTDTEHEPGDSTDTSCHPAALDPDALARECEFRATRRSGPGGQNRNKVETAVVLMHRPTGIRAEASERRTQMHNRRMALRRLRLELALAVRRPVQLAGESPYRPSALWLGRCRGSRVAVSREHADFPALLAEALDVIVACRDEPGPAALLLGCSSSQLIRLLRLAPRAIGLINERRKQNGRHPLH
jgi:RF-1 domain